MVENKIPNIRSLVKKADYDNKVTEIDKELTDHYHDKYITIPEFNTLAASIFNARLAQANLVIKTDFDAKLSIPNTIQDGLFWGCSQMGFEAKTTSSLKFIIHILQW